MIRNTLLTATLAALSLVHAAVHENLATAPLGWSYASTPSEKQSITFSIGLQQQNLDQLQSLLIKVSTPGSPSYGQYLDKDDVNSLLSPSNESASAVLSWLNQAGVNNTSSDGEWIDVQTDIGTANTLLKANFLTYENDDGATKLRTLHYSIPDDLTAYVDLIHPTTFFGRVASEVSPLKVKRRQPFKQTKRASLKDGNKHPLVVRETPAQINASCLLNNVTGYVTIGPACLKTIYNISYTPDTTPFQSSC